MKNRKIPLPALLSIALTFSLFLPASVLNTASVMAQGQVTPMVAAGYAHTVGLKTDSTVVAAGENGFGQCDVGNWTDITQVAAGYAHTVGLKTDGAVVPAGWNDYEQCDVGNWTDITQVAAGYTNTVGLKTDGTVVAAGRNDYEQCDVGNWTDIIQVAAGGFHTVGLKARGTVVTVGLGDESALAEWNLGLVVPPINWPLIGVIIAVVVVGLVIFFERRDRHA